jgi:hypothetical protein
LSALCVLFLAAAPSRADNIVTTTWATASGATITNSGTAYSVDDSVVLSIDYTLDTITISPLNLENDLTRDVQLLSHIDLTLVNLSAGTTASVSSSSYSAINFSSSSTSVDTPTPGNVWQAVLGTGGALSFCTNCNGSGNSQLIIGAPNPASGNSELYNSSGANNGFYNRSPAILGDGAAYSSGPLAGINSSPVWVLSVPEINHNVLVAPTAVAFGFGTAGGFTTAGHLQVAPTPEPGTVTALIGGGSLLLAMGWRRRHSRRN